MNIYLSKIVALQVLFVHVTRVKTISHLMTCLLTKFCVVAYKFLTSAVIAIFFNTAHTFLVYLKFDLNYRLNYGTY